MTVFEVKLDCYQGPLDFLVQLVRQHEVDVLRLAISQVANAYLQSLQELSQIDIEGAGDFLVLASTLMEFKSRLLVPQNEQEEELEEQESQQQLVLHLLEYKRFKEAAALLWEKAREHQRKLPRSADDLPSQRSDPSSQPIRELELWDLVSAFSRLMKENIVPVTESILVDPTPINVYMEQMAALVSGTGGIEFRDLIGIRNTKPQLINKFLALLELIKCNELWVEIDPETETIFVMPPRAEVSVESDSMPMADQSVPPDVLSHSKKEKELGIPQSAIRNPHSDQPAPDPWTESVTDAGEKTAEFSGWANFEPILESPDEPPEKDEGGRRKGEGGGEKAEAKPNHDR